jgi:hypothetical protein
MAMLLTWRVLVPLPRGVSSMPSGPTRLGLVAALAGGGADGEGAGGRRLYLPVRAVGEIEAVGRRALEDVHAVAHLAPVAAAAPDAGLALDDDQDDLAVSGGGGGALAGGEAVEGEADMAPAALSG